MTGGECRGNYATRWRTEPLKNEHHFGFGITAWYLLPCLEEGLPRSCARCSPCSRNTSVVMPKAASPVPAAQSQTSQEPTALGLVEINTRVTHPRVFFPQMLGQHHPGAVLAWLFPLSCSARPCFRRILWSWLWRTTPVPTVSRDGAWPWVFFASLCHSSANFSAELLGLALPVTPVTAADAKAPT